MSSLFASYLRVYEPLAAFDREWQRYWRRYVNEGRALAPMEGAARQRTAVLEALGAGWTRLPQLPDDAYVLEADDTLLICPWNLRVQVAEAALNARDGVPTVLADAFVPPLFAGLARAVLDDWRSGNRVLEHGVPRLHEQVATWTVPLRWFTFFEPAERALSLRRGTRALRYRTDLAKAQRRASSARAVLRRGVGAASITDAVEETGRWLEQFHPYSVLELDYGGLVHVLSDEALVADDSPGLLLSGLEAVARGDGEAAAVAYEQLADRWQAVQLRERSN
ncbi:MAG: hypothetical protein HKP61_21835 [Dactylosporangium sp.]|nr:hypothetical protein [Dactylosporangium sp.]NNJ63522.1 hypothetical protein [Dactylosporangium sp.]